MNTTLQKVSIRRITGRENTDPVTGEVTRFVSFSLDGEYPYLWAFAADFTELPPTNEPVTLHVTIRAKRTDTAARLSVRVTGWEK